MDDAFEDALKEAISFAPVDVVILETIEIRHPSFLDENLQNTPIRVVNNNSNILALLEADAPVDAGQVVTFTAFGFELTLPAVEPGLAPELIVSVDDVASPFANGKRLSNHIDAATYAGGKIDMVYRAFLSSALGAGPQMRPMYFECDAFDASGGKITGRASFVPDTEQRIFPFKNYDGVDFPLLAAISAIVPG